MSGPMTSPGDKQPPREWWLENACRIAALGLRQQKYIRANTIPVREQVRDSVKFVRTVWEEIERYVTEEWMSPQSVSQERLEEMLGPRKNILCSSNSGIATQPVHELGKPKPICIVDPT